MSTLLNKIAILFCLLITSQLIDATITVLNPKENKFAQRIGYRKKRIKPIRKSNFVMIYKVLKPGETDILDLAEVSNFGISITRIGADNFEKDDVLGYDLKAMNLKDGSILLIVEKGERSIGEPSATIKVIEPGEAKQQEAKERSSESGQ